jgi:Tol biopolymer transport system component
MRVFPAPLDERRRLAVPLLVAGLAVVLGLPGCARTAPLVLIPRGLDGAAPNGRSFPGAISDDGNLVSFTSSASNLVPGDTNGRRDLFVFDRRTESTRRVNVASSGQQANGDVSTRQMISGDGRFVVFATRASNLVQGDTNNGSDVFVHELATGLTERVSVADDGRQAVHAGEVSGPRISDDGDVIAFDASGLDPDQASWSLYLRDRPAHRTDPVPGPPLPSPVALGGLSGDGQVLVHLDPGLDPGFSPYTPTVRDLRTGVDDPILQPFSFTTEFTLAIDRTGRTLVWGGRDQAGHYEVVVADRQTRTVETLASTDGPHATPAISGDGRYLTVFTTAPSDESHALISVLDRLDGTRQRVGVGYWTSIDDSGAAVVVETAEEEGPFLWLRPR